MYCFYFRRIYIIIGLLRGMNQHKNSVAFSVHIKLNFKIIVVGNRHAGKTSLIMRFVKDIFELNYKVTVGV